MAITIGHLHYAKDLPIDSWFKLQDGGWIGLIIASGASGILVNYYDSMGRLMESRARFSRLDAVLYLGTNVPMERLHQQRAGERDGGSNTGHTERG